jgi:Mrp family chromosome partitioning ATPase
MSDIPEDCPGTSSSQAGKSSACQGCPNQKTCLSGEAASKDPSISLVAERLRSVKSVILVLSGKGGVGKSTVSAQLAYTLAQSQDKQVGLLDIDICGPSQPHLMSMKNEEVHTSASGWSPVFHEDFPNLAVMSIGFLIPSSDEPVIWRGPRKNGLIKQFLTDVDWGNLDFLVVDCPPGTSDEHLSIATFLTDVPQKAAIIVTTPHELALLDVRKEIGFCRKTGIDIIGVVENMAGFLCNGCGNRTVLFDENDGVDRMCSDFMLQKIASVPFSYSLSRATQLGIALSSSDLKEFAIYQSIEQAVIKFFSKSS